MPKNHTLAKWGLPSGSVVGIFDNFALFLFLTMALAARAMAMATEMAKATDGEGNGNAKVVIVDGSDRRWQPRQ